MSKRPLRIVLLATLVLTALLTSVKSIWAVNQAKFSLSPPDILPRVGEIFNVDITLDTDGANVKNSDAVLTFDPTRITVVSLTPGRLFDNYPIKSFETPGNIKLSGAMTVATASYSGIGKFGGITFKGATAGTTTVSVSCTPGVSTDSNVIQILTNVDIIDCTKLVPISFTIAKAIGAPTPEATPTPPPASDLTPTFFLTLAGLGLVTLGSTKLWLERKYHD